MYWSQGEPSKSPADAGPPARTPHFVIRPRSPATGHSPLDISVAGTSLPPVMFAFPLEPQEAAPVKQHRKRRGKRKRKRRKKGAKRNDAASHEGKPPKAGLMHKNGYPVQVHHVITEDEYILEVDRMPYGVEGDTPNQRPPVLLVHGIVSSAADFVINKPHQSAGFLLADRGFDVWLINSRGTPYSNYHKTLTTKDPEFWEWSFDEIGRYDLAATIDYVTHVTGFMNISIVAWSQGFTETLVLLSTRPEYNAKVNLVAGYAPVGNISHIETPLTLLGPVAELIASVFHHFTKGGLLTSTPTTQFLITQFCNNVFRGACFLPVNVAVGASREQLNKTRIPVYLAHMPAGTSIRNIIHYTQMYRAQNFIMYNYGFEENLIRYNQPEPYEYPLEHVFAPIALFTGAADRFADPNDVQSLRSRIGDAIVFDYEIPQDTFMHLDFVVGYDATVMLHEPMVALVQGFNEPLPWPFYKRR
ncbi:gastric triacylglycerol lipase-like [Dermacentor variabilis]|uniref:gastric triacylglycerol lipase-like n=1 Tax=Dermacentor variabilis TaxID=34621 RepID=UPI003F5B00CD